MITTNHFPYRIRSVGKKIIDNGFTDNTNLAQPYVVNGVVSGTVLQAVLPFAPVKEIRMSFALTGNEFIAYVRRRDVISPLVGMAVGVVPLPRPLPNVNYNFQIMSAEGLQITADDQGLSGVVYGANLA